MYVLVPGLGNALGFKTSHRGTSLYYFCNFLGVSLFHNMK